MLSFSYSLRLSVLEHCQLRCNYCLPPKPSHNNWLSLEAYQKLARVLRRIPIEKIRFTGGEPLLRKELPEIISIFSDNFPSTKLAMTTNGLLFETQAQALWRAGLRHLTFHLDTLKDERYQKLMGRGKVAQVLSALERARDLGFQLKLNMVVQKEKNDDELWDFLTVFKKYAIQVRFIEMMNTGSAVSFVENNFLSGQKIIEKIKEYSEVISVGRMCPSDPAEQFYVSQLDAKFGLIASDTQPFCGECNRLRMSATGKLFTCLYDSYGADLSSGSEEELYERLIKKIALKESFHPGLEKPHRRLFSMSETGG